MFIQEATPFDEHFIEVECSVLASHDLSIFRYKDFPDAFLFYGITNKTPTEFLVDQIHIGTDFVIAVFPSKLNGNNIVSIANEQKLIQVLCTNNVVLSHESTIPDLFDLKSPPPYLPQLTPTLTDQAIRQGYALRYVEVLHRPATLDELLSLQPPQTKPLPPVFQRLLASDFEVKVERLIQIIPDPFESTTEDVVSWLVERDKLQSLYIVVGQWKPAVHDSLLQLDNRFPLHQFSHILPSSKVLAEAWRQDPTCWWGQSAALHEILSESTS